MQPGNVRNENPYVLLILPTVGSLCVWGVAKSMSGWKWLVSIGNRSFAIMAGHFLAFKIANLIICLVYNEPFAHIAKFPTMGYSH